MNEKTLKEDGECPKSHSKALQAMLRLLDGYICSCNISSYNDGIPVHFFFCCSLFFFDLLHSLPTVQCI